MDNRKESEILKEEYEKAYSDNRLNDAKYYREKMILAKEKEKRWIPPFQTTKQ